MPLPCAHCVLAAKPTQVAPSEPSEPAPVLVISAPTKRGPKPKFGVTMTPAQRKALSRENQKTKLQDAERRKLTTELMKVYRRQQSKV